MLKSPVFTMNPFSGIAAAKASVTFYLIVRYRLNYCRRHRHHCYLRHLCHHHHHCPHSIVVRDILESMAQYKDSFDIQGNDIWFFDAIFVRDHRLYSNKNYNQAPVLAELRDNAANDSLTITLDSAIFKYTHTHIHTEYSDKILFAVCKKKTLIITITYLWR